MASGHIKQYGAIPYIRENGQLKVVLVTSAAGYWIFPKGNYEEERGKCGTAQMEAFEEAGVRGRVDAEHSYRTTIMISGGRRAKLVLFPMEVDRVFEDWPEALRRERRLVNLTEADQLIDSDGLKKCLGSFARDFLD